MPAMPDRTLVIASGEQNSAAFGTGQATRGSFQVPTFTGTAITVQVTNEDTPTNFTSCPVEGNEANPITVTSNGTYALPVKTFNFKFFRLRSGSAEGASRTITVFLRD